MPSIVSETHIGEALLRPFPKSELLSLLFCSSVSNRPGPGVELKAPRHEAPANQILTYASNRTVSCFERLR